MSSDASFRGIAQALAVGLPCKMEWWQAGFDAAVHYAPYAPPAGEEEAFSYARGFGAGSAVSRTIACCSGERAQPSTSAEEEAA